MWDDNWKINLCFPVKGCRLTPLHNIYMFFAFTMIALNGAACVRCHRTKCPLLMAFFLLEGVIAWF